ncbi:secreted RxLR effector protein 161-like [Daphnia magna]|uniref:secreted RxLR effector protein 161-like n=1 Tax=Daphnia magna TaxID=35525 RepID=UPI001E1BD3DB|nr:secreted RxLR effector protein 161-like [Daphnia magna]
MSCSDISFAVGQVSRFCANYLRAHWNTVEEKKIFAYLKGKQDLALCYGKKEPSPIIGYCDTDYGGDVDDYRLTTGYIFFCKGGSVSWASRKQPITAQLTAESEYLSANEATKEASWFTQVIVVIAGKEITPITIKCDDDAAIASSQRPKSHGRLKNILVKTNLIREHVKTERVKLEFVPSTDQLVEIFTKPLKEPDFKKMREWTGLKL